MFQHSLVYSGVERMLLSLCCRFRLYGILFLLLLPLAIWLWFRLTRPDHDGMAEPTLCSPERLDAVLRTFMNNTANIEPSTSMAPKRHKTETLCRAMLERMLGFPLPKVRPPFLRNPTTNRCLELDMYNAEHSLAFEFDGAQHTTFTPHYHTNEHHFQYRQLLDQLKTDLCKEHGVRLIRINWDKVKVSDPVKTALYLEGLLKAQDIAHRSILQPVKGKKGSNAPSQPKGLASRCTAP